MGFGRILAASVLGGLVVFLWGAVSWMSLPLHQMTVQGFDDEAQVSRVIASHAPGIGVYVLPNMHKVDERQLSEQQADAQTDAVQCGREAP